MLALGGGRRLCHARQGLTMKRLKLSVYDFDGTLYGGDATFDFWKYLLKSGWWRISFLPLQCMCWIFWKAGCMKTERFKEIFLAAAPRKGLQVAVADFWRIHEKKIFPWAFSELENDARRGFMCVCVSASPRFLLEPVLEELGFDAVLCTEMENGKVVSRNCKGEEKVKRLYAFYEGTPFDIVKMISDSDDDLPLYELAERRFRVEKDGTRKEMRS